MVAQSRLSSTRRHPRWWRFNRFWQVYVPVAVMVVLTLFPFYWMFITSFKADAELYNVESNPLIATQLTFDHYTYLIQETLFPRWTFNSLIVSVASTAISLVCSVLAGYALGRLRFKGANVIGWIIFAAYLLPQTLLFIPLTQQIGAMGMLDTYWALILIYPTFLVPFSTWLLIGFFRSIPRELEESALIDGATRLQAMWYIIIPLALPGLLSVGIFSFTLSWNEFIYALVFLSDIQLKTIPLGVTSELIRGDVFFWGSLMAGALLGSVPVALIYSFFVEYFVAGLTAGAVKG
ncbi:MAG: carbohydrate ABC transporter permease [Chloroflexales bacterium]|nr:carbohydrate ABC transporter permease [Chloroflexales bacterium]